MNIYQKLVEVRKAVPYLQKAAEGHQYKYVSSSQVLGTLKAKMDELGLLLVPKVIGHKVTSDTIESVDKYNTPKHTTTYFTEVDMEFMWVNAEKPDETIVCTWYGQGVDIAGEKGVGKAMTYAEKYFMLKFFNIATDKDDSDSFQKKFEDDEPKAPEKKPETSKDDNPQAGLITKAQAKRLYALAKGNVTLIKQVMKAYGYEHSEEIKVTDYDKIAKDIENTEIA